MNLHKTYDQRKRKMQFLQNNVTFFSQNCLYIYRKSLVSLNIAIEELNLKFCENLNFITFDKLNINLGKTYAKLRIFPKIFLRIGLLVFDSKPKIRLWLRL